MLNVICAYCHVMSIILTVVMLSVIDTNSGVASVKIWKIYAFIGINNVEKINILNGKWATFYLNDYRNNVSANYFTNRFPITWGGISIIGELFPCSLICPSAIKYSKTMHSDVINFGFNEIAKVMVEHALKPIYINEEDGSISTIFKEGTDLIKFS